MSDERVACDQCGAEFSLQDQAFIEGPGLSWWCHCPSCKVLLDPDTLESALPPLPLRARLLGRALDAMAAPIYAPLTACTDLGFMPPTWLIRGTVFLASPIQTAALRARGWNGGVSGS